jgi:hypothetical protein
MASRDGEAATETSKRVLMWEEFTWKVASGEYGLDTKLKDVDIDGFDDFFGNSGWAVQDLFTVGNPALREHIEDVAFGSNLHAIEDSFANGHVQREETATNGSCAGLPQFPEPRRIIEFHSYAHQDEHKHAQEDAREAFDHEMNTDKPNVVLVGRTLRDFRKTGAKWEMVKPYYECVFALTDSASAASPGRDFAIEQVP